RPRQDGDAAGLPSGVRPRGAEPRAGAAAARLQGGCTPPAPPPSKCSSTRIQTRIANEKYLRTHKEVELLLSGFFREMFLKRPDNIQEFAADYFTDPRLPNKIHMQLIKEKKAA
uniref:Regulatory subunit of type II PKA R-subunit domain containing 1 n=1 Tax=Equus asinus TaxID=9793 RepID=A0A9L0JS96_EQUAS